MTKKEQIISKVIEILKENPEGVRYAEILRRVKEDLPEIPKNTIQGTMVDLEKSDEIYKPERGLFRHISFRGKEVSKPAAQPEKKIKEQDFYKSFADYLVDDLGDCTKAIPLGGNKFKDKWNTPDVIGIYKSRMSDIIKHETEIISAEIKTDDTSIITAFGQACAYKVFSHKVYIVIPNSASQGDKERIISLCMIFGIGLIFFDATNTESPQFEISVRPMKHEPDSFYVNECVKSIESELFS